MCRKHRSGLDRCEIGRCESRAEPDPFDRILKRAGKNPGGLVRHSFASQEFYRLIVTKKQREYKITKKPRCRANGIAVESFSRGRKKRETHPPAYSADHCRYIRDVVAVNAPQGSVRYETDDQA